MSILIFGDSFIGPFKLIKDKNIKIFKYKGATMKGITKINNENRLDILNQIKNNKKPKCIIFNFGQVDLYFSYYYKKFVEKKNFIMKSSINNYVEFIKNLNCNDCNKIIINVYPTTLDDEYVFKALLKYGIISEDIMKSIDKSDIKKTSNFKFRYQMYTKFNNLLEESCKLNNIKFLNLNKYLLNKNNKLKSKFINPESKTSIHLLWEPLIEILISNLIECNIPKIYKINIKTSLNKYVKDKKKR